MQGEGTLRRVINLLVSFPGDGQPERSAGLSEALILGFVEKVEEPKACKTCGHTATGYTYFKITDAGRILMLANSRKEDARHD